MIRQAGEFLSALRRGGRRGPLLGGFAGVAAGLAVGGAVVGWREAIALVQSLALGTAEASSPRPGGAAVCDRFSPCFWAVWRSA
jgi:hypothetical protein